MPKRFRTLAREYMKRLHIETALDVPIFVRRHQTRTHGIRYEYYDPAEKKGGSYTSLKRLQEVLREGYYCERCDGYHVYAGVVDLTDPENPKTYRFWEFLDLPEEAMGS